MAAAGVVVVVGFVEGEEHRPPSGVHVVSLRPDEPLADEWSVVAVGPHAGAFLVATDQHAFDPSERDHEASREFVGRWGYSRAQAGTELARLRFSLGDRLDVVLRGTIDDLLAEYMPSGGDPAASSGTPGETWATTSLGHMMDGMLTARAGTRELREQLADAQRAATARAAATTDPHSGVANPDFLQRWSHPTGANPLPIGLALFDVAELDSEAMRADDRASYFAAHQVAAALTQPLGPVDAVVRMSAREFLVVVPGASPATWPVSATGSASSWSWPRTATRTSRCGPGSPRSSPAGVRCRSATCTARSPVSTTTAGTARSRPARSRGRSDRRVVDGAARRRHRPRLRRRRHGWRRHGDGRGSSGPDIGGGGPVGRAATPTPPRPRLEISPVRATPARTTPSRTGRRRQGALGHRGTAGVTPRPTATTTRASESRSGRRVPRPARTEEPPTGEPPYRDGPSHRGPTAPRRLVHQS